jgi:short-subunit dehydrogenase
MRHCLAKELGTHGYQLVLAARREQELEQVVAQSRTKAMPTFVERHE